MQFEALSQVDSDDTRVEQFDRIVRAGPWSLATLDGLLARNPMPFAAVLVHDRSSALKQVHERISDGNRSLAVIGYRESIDPAAVVDAMHGGAIDYLSWPLDPATLSDRLRIASARFTRRLHQTRTRRVGERRLASLSEREREVLAALTAGHSSKIIAQELGISQRTVETHRANLVDKLGVSNSTQAAVLAARADFA